MTGASVGERGGQPPLARMRGILLPAVFKFAERNHLIEHVNLVGKDLSSCAPNPVDLRG
jgi:hypothetical protein